MMIHEITQLVGKHRKRKRIGRGQGSGHGKTSGRGHKGAGSRAGFSQNAAREGGQIPYFRRIPKRGFTNNRFRTYFHVVNVRDLETRFTDGQVVNADTLAQVGLIRDTSLPIKVLGDGELTRKLEVTATKVSASAREKIEKAGGQVTLVEKKKWTRDTAAPKKKTKAPKEAG